MNYATSLVSIQTTEARQLVFAPAFDDGVKFLTGFLSTYPYVANSHEIPSPMMTILIQLIFS